MISFEEALETILDFTRSPDTEIVPLESALGRVLASAVVSDVDVPPADLSAMDGFACKKEDLASPLRVIETIAAGAVPQKQIRRGECSRIMTGAMVPQGADCVVMVEHTTGSDDLVTVNKSSNNRNIRFRAEDVRKGDSVLAVGTRVTPAITAVLASCGCAMVPVARLSAVGVIATGDELVEASRIPSAAQIRNTNSPQLCAQAVGAGALARYHGRAADTPEATESLVRKALVASDVVLISGGVSAGDFDFVPSTLEKIGANILFSKVAIKPGKPMLFATLGSKAIFGMPGNPVSTFVVFELFVRPYLAKAMGSEFKPTMIKARLVADIKRKKGDRIEFIPVRFTKEGLVERPDYHGSAHIHSYVSAQGILALNPEDEFLAAGTEILVRLISQD